MGRARHATADGEAIRASLRDPERFAALVDAHHAAVHRYLSRRLGRELADDLAAETFARAFAARARYVDVHADALPWLYGIATNLVRAHRRSERGLRAFASLGSDPDAELDVARVAERLDAERRSADLARALLALTPAQRDAVCLRALAGLSVDETAAVLATTPDSIKALLRRARAALAAALAHVEDDPEEARR